jgi:hypothetical protein
VRVCEHGPVVVSSPRRGELDACGVAGERAVDRTVVDSLNGAGLLAHRIGASLTAGAGMLALALLIALAVRPRRAAEIAVRRRGPEPAARRGEA